MFGLPPLSSKMTVHPKFRALLSLLLLLLLATSSLAFKCSTGYGIYPSCLPLYYPYYSGWYGGYGYRRPYYFTGLYG
jgi:hypothetical protein